MAEPRAEPVVEPRAEPMVKPLVESMTEPVVEPVLEPVVEPGVNSVVGAKGEADSMAGEVSVGVEGGLRWESLLYLFYKKTDLVTTHFCKIGEKIQNFVGNSRKII